MAIRKFEERKNYYCDTSDYHDFFFHYALIVLLLLFFFFFNDYFIMFTMIITLRKIEWDELLIKSVLDRNMQISTCKIIYAKYVK